MLVEVQHGHTVEVQFGQDLPELPIGVVPEDNAVAFGFE
jgi:hypothetical protein